MQLSSSGTFKAWLRKVKGDTARAKWLWSSSARYYTIDFNSQTFYYSHSEDQREVSHPIHFRDILEAAQLPVPPGRGPGRGFRVKTRSRTYELYTTAEPHAEAWVNALNAASNIGRSSSARSAGPPMAAEGQQPATGPGGYRDTRSASTTLAPLHGVVGSPAPPDGRTIALGSQLEHARQYAANPPEGEELDELTCRTLLRKVPCELRSAAASKYPEWRWAAMSWRERIIAIKGHCGSPEDLMDFLRHWANEEIEGLRLRGHGPPAAAPQQVPVGPSARPAHLPPPLDEQRISVGAQDVERLRAVFATSDSLQVLVSHHLAGLADSVVRAMRPRNVPSGEVLVRQGCEGDSMYIVDSGAFDVFLEKGGGQQPLWVCRYGPGAAFGELAMVSNASRPATVVAASPARVWTLTRERFRSLLKAPDGTKTIGLLGGVMLLINNLAGPTIVSMPALAQEAGWLAVLMVQAVVALFAAVCGHMLIEAMSRMPGNANFEQRIEFTNLVTFYLPRPACAFVMLCYHVNSILSLMSLIIQSGQVMDYVMLNMNGCAPGFQVSPKFRYVCGIRTDSVTPFGDGLVVSGSMAIVAAVCAPFAVKNLDDNVVLQYVAVVGLCLMAVVWVCLLVVEPDFPQPLPAATWSQGSLIGTVLFNFAFTSTLPSWVNEKRSDVSVSASFCITMVYVVLVYTVIGMVGGMAYKPFYTTDENLFSKLNAGGSRLGRATVTAYPMLQNFTSIPVFSILIRYNLLQSGLAPSTATAIAVGLPWVLSIPFYTGNGFNTISEYGGLVTSSVINFIVPAVLYALAIGRQGLARTM